MGFEGFDAGGINPIEPLGTAVLIAD